MVTTIIPAVSTWLLAWLLAVCLVVPQPAAAKSRHTAALRSAPAGAAEPLAGKVPLPQPRPAEATQPEAAKGQGKPPDIKPSDSANGSDKGRGDAARAEDGKDETKPAPPEPSACRLALTEEIAVAPSIPPIHGPGACGGEDLVRLEAVVLPDKRHVALTPAATMRCTMATAVVNWIRDDVAPVVNKLGSEITALDNFDSYQCRGRNGKSSGPLSEHAKANAIDVHGFKLADGRMVELTDRTQPRELREDILHSACTRFPTVLGPDSDWYHEDHIHLDLIERRSNYRICQWDVLDPLPKVAPLMPEARPGEAPPRMVAEAVGGKTKEEIGANTGNRSNGTSQEAKTGDDNKPDGKPTPDKASPEASVDKSKAALPMTSPAANRKTAVATDDGTKPEGKLAADRDLQSKATKAEPDRGSTEKATGNTEKASRRKMAADKPALRKRRHTRRLWNPFEALF